MIERKIKKSRDVSIIIPPRTTSAPIVKSSFVSARSSAAYFAFKVAFEATRLRSVSASALPSASNVRRRSRQAPCPQVCHDFFLSYHEFKSQVGWKNLKVVMTE